MHHRRIRERVREVEAQNVEVGRPRGAGYSDS